LRKAIILLCLLAVPALAQTPPSPTSPVPVPLPLPQWFADIDTAKKGEVSRDEFLKHRMKLFDALDADRDGKLSVEEFLKIAEPPFSADVPGGPSLEERRSRARAQFQSVDTNRDQFVDRAEMAAVYHGEFNQYDTDRDNKITEAELRLIVQRSLARDAERQQMEARRRLGLAINDIIDMQLGDADKLDRNNDGRISQQEYLALTGPADGQQAQGLLPYDIRRQLIVRKFQEIDSNKDGVIDRVELTAYAVRQFLGTDLDRNRFLNEEELKKAKETDDVRTREIIQKLVPKPAAPPRPAPIAPPPGLPQQTR
jgi:Ca2+-binding EF-hand superfamily protein